LPIPQLSILPATRPFLHPDCVPAIVFVRRSSAEPQVTLSEQKSYQNLREFCLVDFEKHDKNLTFSPRPLTLSDSRFSTCVLKHANTEIGL